jgi:hypothetical protein
MAQTVSSHFRLRDFSWLLSLYNIGADPLENTISNDAISYCIYIRCQGDVVFYRYLATAVSSVSTVPVFQLPRHSIIEWSVEADILTQFPKNTRQVNHKPPPLYSM